MPIYETPEPISVTVDLGVGNVRMTAGGRTDTVVEVRPSNESKTADLKAAEETRVEFGSGRLLIKTPKDWRRYSLFSSGGSVDVTIEMPSGSEVHGSVEMGGVEGQGELGACELSTGMGSIRLDRTGPLSASTGFGEVVVGRIAGDADISTGSGEVRIGAVDGTVVIRNSNGYTKLGDVAGDLRVKAANGSIHVDHAGDSVTAKSANGSIRVGDVVRGTIVLETAAGDLEVGIHQGSAAWLDVSTRHGNVRNSLDVTEGPDQSDTTVEVRARTPYGDIVISRSPRLNHPGETRKP